MAPRALLSPFSPWSHRSHFTDEEKKHREDEPVPQVSQLGSGRGGLGTQAFGLLRPQPSPLQGAACSTRLHGSPNHPPSTHAPV